MQKNDLLQSVNEALLIELGDYQQVTDIEKFSQYTEGRTYKGAIFFNQYNIIFTDLEDFKHCSYYNKKGIVCELSLPTYEFDLYILSHKSCPILQDAISYKA